MTLYIKKKIDQVGIRMREKKKKINDVPYRHDNEGHF